MPKNKPQESSPATRRDALRRQQQAQQAAARRGALTVRIAWIFGLVLIAAMIGVIAWAVAGSSGGSDAATGRVVAPAGATQTGALLIGDPDAPVTVTVYADFMCPWCGRFEQANGDHLATAVTTGTAKLEIHPMSFLDDASQGTKFSTRAANAFVTIAEADPAAALRFYQLVFAHQPEENSAGLTDEQLAQLAEQAQAPAEAIAAFGKLTFAPWIAQTTDQIWATKAISGTPTVKINGELFTGDMYTAGPLADAIAAAANG